MINHYSKLNIFLRGFGEVFIFSNLGNLFSYIFIFILGRYLSNSDFSVFMAINSFIAILVSPIAFSPMILSKSYINNFSFNTELKVNFIKNLTFLVLILVIVLDIFYLILFEQIKDFLNYEVNYHLILTIIIFNLSYLCIPFHGIFQGEKKFLKFSIIASFPMISKVIYLIILILYFNKNNVFDLVFYSTILSFVSTLFLTYVFLNQTFILKLGHISIKIIIDILKSFKNFQFILFCNIFYLFLLSIDVIIANRILPTDESAIYTKISVISKSIFFLMSSLSTVIFPIAVQNKVNRNIAESYKNLFQGFILFTIISVFVILFLYYFKDLVFKITFNISISEYEDLFLIQSISIVILTLSQFIAVFNLANKKNNFIYLYILITILYIILSSMLVVSINYLVYLNISTSSVTFLVALYQLSFLKNEKN